MKSPRRTNCRPETSLGALIGCVDDADALASASVHGGWQHIAGRLLVISPDDAAIKLARVHGGERGKMEFTIQEQGLPSFDVDFADDGRRWLAEVRPAADGDLRVNVFRLGAASAHANRADHATRPPVGSWVVSCRADPDAVALGIANLLAMLPRSG